MYENCKMLNLDGSFMAYVEKKKMDWYLEKNLAEKIDSKTFKLKFAPKGTGVVLDYLKLPLKNECVCCGIKQNLTRHHIVPYKFRKQLPLEYKSHSNFDIVLLCESCHSNYEMEASKYWYSIISKLYEEDFKNIKILKNIDKHITTLKTNKNIPDDRKLQILHNLQHYYNNPNITIDSLNTLKKVEKYEELDYTELFEHFGGCFKFIISCRQHFLKTAKPKFISPDWVNSIFKKETYLNKI